MNLASFKTVNAKVTTESKRDTYDVRIVNEKESIIFTAHAFKAMDLLNNSLDQRKDEETGAIALVTVPGNAGTFAKRVKDSKNKGKLHKNARLIADLRAMGITRDYLKLDFIGEQDNERFYLVREFEGEVEVPTAEEEAEVASEEAQAASDEAAETATV
jgi:hypothetical protein